MHWGWMATAGWGGDGKGGKGGGVEGRLVKSPNPWIALRTDIPRRRCFMRRHWDGILFWGLREGVRGLVVAHVLWC